MTRSLQIVALLVVALLIPYVGTYVWFSWHGRYEPVVIGLSGVKWYEWAPQGFVHDDHRWNLWVWRAYFPVHKIDRTCWHSPLDSSDIERTSFPVNVVADEDVGLLYRAWGALE